MRHTKRVFFLIPMIVLAMALGSLAQSKDQQSQDRQSKVQHFKMQGTVKSVDSKQHRLVVQHGDIPGFMAAMTMSYPVGKTEDLTKIAPGDRIQADVAVSQTEAHLENIKVTDHAKAKDAKDSQK